MLNHLGSEHVSASRHSFEQLLIAIIKRAAQLQSALDQRIIGNKHVGPDRLHQFLLADQPPRMFHQILKRLIYLWTKLDLLYSLENTTPCEIQGEGTELIA
jgi:hypothetical protein